MDLSDRRIASYLSHIQRAIPDLAITSARLHNDHGQFNHVLTINDTLIFRFPRAPQSSETLARETALLDALQGRLPLTIPTPIYQIVEPLTGEIHGVGYPKIPGEPLWNEVIAAISDEPTLDRMSAQLAEFLHALHHLPLAEIAPDWPMIAEAAAWNNLHQEFTANLYRFMRPDARRATDNLFTAIDRELHRNPPTLTLRHADFGGSNILYDPDTKAISGVLDFGFAGIGDPAADVAAFSCYGEEFLARGYAAYPEMARMLPRARLYRATFALQQALYALQQGDREDFDDGIRAYI